MWFPSLEISVCRQVFIFSAWNHLFKLQRRGPPRRRHEKCCRCGTRTGAHHGAHICPAKFWLNGNIRSRKTNCPYIYMKKYGGGRGSRVPGIYLFVGSLFCVGGYRVHTEVLHYNMNMGEEGDWVTNVATVCLEGR